MLWSRWKDRSRVYIYILSMKWIKHAHTDTWLEFSKTTAYIHVHARSFETDHDDDHQLHVHIR